MAVQKGRKYDQSVRAVSFRNEEIMNQQDRWQCKNGRKYEPTEIDGSARMEESMNQ
jgi:hypothetical protein